MDSRHHGPPDKFALERPVCGTTSGRVVLQSQGIPSPWQGYISRLKGSDPPYCGRHGPSLGEPYREGDGRIGYLLRGQGICLTRPLFISG